MTFPAVDNRIAESLSGASIQASGRPHRTETQAKAGESKQSWALGLLCAVVALIAGLAQNLSEQNARVIAAFDSGHYLGSAQLVVAGCWAWMNHLSDAQVYLAHHLQLSQLPPYLLLDGPLLPISGALPFIVLGKVPGIGDWQIFVGIECLYHALGAFLIFQLCRRLCDNVRVALAAGICWALYPPAIIGAGCFLTEVPVAACELGYLLSLSFLAERLERPQQGLINDRKAILAAIAAGLCAALVFTTKPGLAIAVASALIPLLVVNQRRALASAALMAASALVIIGPWAAYGWTHTGTLHLAAQRMPVLNAAKGGDLISDGVSTNPSTPTAANFSEHDSVLLPVLKPWSEDALGAANLLLRKPERLWSAAWNDFRFSCLKIGPATIVWWHRIALALGLAGLVSFAWRKFRPGQAVPFAIGWGSIAIISGHLIYCLFETLPRYGFTAMPFFLVLGAGALAFAIKQQKLGLFLGAITATIITQAMLFINCLPVVLVFLNTINNAYIVEFAMRATMIAITAIVLSSSLRPTDRKDRSTFTGITALALIAATLVGSLIAHFNTALEPNEWRCTLGPGCAAMRNIDLSNNMQVKAHSPDWALVLVDGDRYLENAQVRVNGHDLQGRLESVYKYDDTNYYQLNWLRVLANIQRKDTNAMRQWRAVQVPVEYLNLQGDNRISVSPRGTDKVTVYGAYPPPFTHKQPFLCLTYCSFGNLIRNSDRLDSRIVDPAVEISSQRNMYSRQKHFDVKDLSPAPGRQAGEYRINLVLGFLPGAAHDAGKNGSSTQQSSAAPMEILLGPALFGQYNSPVLAVSSTGTECALDLPELATDGQTHLEVSLLGDCWSGTGGPGSMIAMLTIKGSGIKGTLSDETELAVPDTPAAILCSQESHPFAVESELPLVALPAGKRQLEIKLSGTGCAVSNLRLLVKTVHLPSFARHTISIN